MFLYQLVIMRYTLVCMFCVVVGISMYVSVNCVLRNDFVRKEAGIYFCKSGQMGFFPFCLLTTNIQSRKVRHQIGRLWLYENFPCYKVVYSAAQRQQQQRTRLSESAVKGVYRTVVYILDWVGSRSTQRDKPFHESVDMPCSKIKII